MKKLALISVVLLTGCVIRTDASEISRLTICKNNAKVQRGMGWSEIVHKYNYGDTTNYIRYSSNYYRVETPRGYGWLSQDSVCN